MNMIKKIIISIRTIISITIRKMSRCSGRLFFPPINRVSETPCWTLHRALLLTTGCDHGKPNQIFRQQINLYLYHMTLWLQRLVFLTFMFQSVGNLTTIVGNTVHLPCRSKYSMKVELNTESTSKTGWNKLGGTLWPGCGSQTHESSPLRKIQLSRYHLRLQSNSKKTGKNHTFKKQTSLRFSFNVILREKCVNNAKRMNLLTWGLNRKEQKVNYSVGSKHTVDLTALPWMYGIRRHEKPTKAMSVRNGWNDCYLRSIKKCIYS